MMLKCDGCGRLDSLEYAYDKEMKRSYRYSVLDIKTCRYCDGEFCEGCLDDHVAQCGTNLPATTECERKADTVQGGDHSGQNAA